MNYIRPRDIPGLDKHPDLMDQFTRAIRSVTGPNCRDCDRMNVIRKFARLVESRERVSRFSRRR